MRFGLIGLGAIGRVRKAAIETTPGCSLTALFDCNKELLRKLARGVQVFESTQQMFESDACEAIIISTPPDVHEPLAIAAMEQGKHVLVEKPMANSLEACRRMLETSRRTGKVLTVGFNHRYFAAVKVIREAIGSGAIGALRYIKSFAGHTGLSEFKASWMYTKDVMGGGTLMDNGIHIIDLTRHLMGEVTGVAGIARGDIWKLDGVEDNAFVLLQGANRVVGALHSSWSEWKGYHFYIEAYGDRGMARAYYAPMSSMVVTMEKPGGKRSVKRDYYIPTIFRERLKGWQSTAVDTFREEFPDFIELTKGKQGSGVIAQAIDGYRAIEIANAVYRSSASGEMVQLEEGI